MIVVVGIASLPVVVVHRSSGLKIGVDDDGLYDGFYNDGSCVWVNNIASVILGNWIFT